MDEETLNEILGESEINSKPETTFLADKADRINSAAENQNEGSDNAERLYTCRHDGCRYTTTKWRDLMTHYQIDHKAAKKYQQTEMIEEQNPRKRLRRKQKTDKEIISEPEPAPDTEPELDIIATPTSPRPEDLFEDIEESASGIKDLEPEPEPEIPRQPTQKRKAIKENKDTDSMSGRKKKKKSKPEEDILLEMQDEPIPEPEPEIELEEKPKTKSRRKEIAPQKTAGEIIQEADFQAPTLLDRLKDLLLGYNVSRRQGILHSASFYELDKPGFIPILERLLRNSGTPPALLGSIIESWSQMTGIRVEDPLSQQQQIGTTSTTTTIQKPATANFMELMNQLRTEEFNDTMMERYKTQVEDKKLESEMKRKRIYGGDAYSTETGQLRRYYDEKFAKLEQLLNTAHQNQLQSMAQKDPQSDMLKQQVDLLKNELAETRRKHDEDVRIAQLREEARRDRELIERKLEEQTKQTQEVIKGLQTAQQPKTEDLLRQQIADMQRQFNEQLMKLNNDFLDTQREKEYNAQLEWLKEDARNRKEDTEGQIGQLTSNMDKFSTNMQHAFEKSMMDREAKEREVELKKKISEMEHSKSLTNEQYAFENTKKLLENLGTGIKDTIDNALSKAEEPAKHAAKVTADREKLNMILDLQRTGKFTNEQIAAMFAEKQSRPPVIPRGTAQQEWEQLKRLSESGAGNKTQSVPASAPPTATEPITTPEPEVPVTEVKFAAED